VAAQLPNGADAMQVVAQPGRFDGLEFGYFAHMWGIRTGERLRGDEGEDGRDGSDGKGETHFGIWKERKGGWVEIGGGTERQL
jgi:hypothetical protein